MWLLHVQTQFSLKIALGQQNKQPLGSPASFTLAFASWLLRERSHPLGENKQTASPAWFEAGEGFTRAQRATGAAVRLHRVLWELL